MPIRRHEAMRRGRRVSSRRERIVRFFLTLNAKNLIKETQPRALMSGAKFDIKGESIDEERNEEESAAKKKAAKKK